MNSRDCVVQSAQGWFDAAQKAVEAGELNEALLYMTNAFNHTENALVAVLRAADFKDQPPLSGRPRKTLDEMRADLSALTSTAPRQGD